MSGGAGREQTALALSKTQIAAQSGTESGTPNGEKAPLDPDLAKIIAAWPELPSPVRSAVLAIVRNAIGQ
jgi:hypothetical protein